MTANDEVSPNTARALGRRLTGQVDDQTKPAKPTPQTPQRETESLFDQ
ncbi:hypothetical protein [Amycolatopsis rhizosphaerae]|nr:hypothetical protein [Amycolatopsis rhizosphaerae]